MKLIHCADVHLDSRLNTHLDKKRAGERRAELLHSFLSMVDYADKNGVEAILISGDLYDTDRVSATTRNAVRSCIASYPHILFFYLRGNHDQEEVIDPGNLSNLKLFGASWTSYSYGRVTVWGAELTPGNQGRLFSELQTDPERINLVMLHGQETEAAGMRPISLNKGAREISEVIPLRALRNKGIDYLALGHVHRYSEKELDGRGIACYPGCLEGRGFDECGEHGFVLLDIDERAHAIHRRFVPWARRRLWELPVDISGCMTTFDIAGRVQETLRNCYRQKAEQSTSEEFTITQEDLLRILLTGQVDVECEKNLTYLRTAFADAGYLVLVEDASVLRIDPSDYALDESLKGEFVRTILADSSLTEEEKNIVIRYGLQAMEGEEIGE